VNTATAGVAPASADQLIGRRVLPALRRLAAATRVGKVLPLLLVMACAARLRGPVAGPRYLPCALFVLVISALGMQLNVLTDAALDRDTKPQLLRWLTVGPRLLAAVMAGEGVVAAGILGWSWIRLGPTAVLALLGYAAGFILYSYNFLFFSPAEAARHRLKVSWWGNLLAVVGGYFALWMLGAQSARAASPTLAWQVLALSACLVDYGVFLNECAGDAASERAHGMNTLAARLGRRRASAVAALFTLLGAAGVAAALASGSTEINGRGVAALAWHLGVQAVACTVLTGVARGAEVPRWWERAVDSSFWISRAGMLLILVV
jgi:4-hydroxybenzoate polyprenyltransferase